MKLRCEHRLELDAETFWQWIHSPEFESRVARAAGLVEYEPIHRSEDERQVFRRIRVTPTLPPALASLLSRLPGAAAGTGGPFLERAIARAVREAFDRSAEVANEMGREDRSRAPRRRRSRARAVASDAAAPTRAG